MSQWLVEQSLRPIVSWSRDKQEAKQEMGIRGISWKLWQVDSHEIHL